MIATFSTLKPQSPSLPHWIAEESHRLLSLCQLKPQCLNACSSRKKRNYLFDEIKRKNWNLFIKKNQHQTLSIIINQSEFHAFPTMKVRRTFFTFFLQCAHANLQFGLRLGGRALGEAKVSLCRLKRYSGQLFIFSSARWFEYSQTVVNFFKNFIY